MKTALHGAAGTMALALILAFWFSTVVSELVLGLEAIRMVKLGIVYGMTVLIPVLIAAGISGFVLARRGGASRILARKQRRMPFVALNGILLLVPAALFLQSRAADGNLDAVFYGVQALELLAGGVNIVLLTLNMRDGLMLSRAARAPGHGPAMQ